MAKIKSFKGRRLIADISTEQVASNTGVDEAVIKRIESLEEAIRLYNDFLDAKLASLED